MIYSSYLGHNICYHIVDSPLAMWNHSKNPNTSPINPLTKELDLRFSYAARDIDAGEELFDDYRLYKYPE